MPEPRDMEGPVEREEALAAKELRKAKAASAERLCVAPRNGRKPLSVECPNPGQLSCGFPSERPNGHPPTRHFDPGSNLRRDPAP